MSKNYRDVQPVKQIEQMSCWAASMEWWLKYMSPERPIRNQDEIAALESIDKHIDYGEKSPNYGALNEAGMRALCEEFQMDCLIYPPGGAWMTLDTVKYRMEDSGAPLLIAYSDPAVSGAFHANIICGRFKTGGKTRGVVAMEPRSASFEYRFVEYYNQGNLMIGWKK